eukprot:GHVU01052984.1.p1 GENE.GHVU01052984.1~~GHVU01052984.1.p1  ORF type:complete len:214 (-),score=17.38 GHVU01052984.1:427-1068(-)
MSAMDAEVERLRTEVASARSTSARLVDRDTRARTIVHQLRDLYADESAASGEGEAGAARVSCVTAVLEEVDRDGFTASKPEPCQGKEFKRTSFAAEQQSRFGETWQSFRENINDGGDSPAAACSRKEERLGKRPCSDDGELGGLSSFPLEPSVPTYKRQKCGENEVKPAGVPSPLCRELLYGVEDLDFGQGCGVEQCLPGNGKKDSQGLVSSA